MLSRVGCEGRFGCPKQRITKPEPPALAELRLTSGRLECKMQVQNPVQAPIAFEAIAAKIVWQRCLAIDAWQIFYLTINLL
jgi:hypothetical protein